MPACGGCADWPVVLVAARCATPLRWPADRLVHALKYQGWRGAARVMGRRMASVLPPLSADTAVVPVPTTRSRERKRGWNQARVLALEVARIRGLTCLDVLRRSEGSSSQIALPVAERRANVEHAFAAADSAALPPHVILVDDVLTTGATASAAAGILHEIGVRTVTLLAFARTLPRGVDAA